MGSRPKWMRKIGIQVALLSLFIVLFVIGNWVKLTIPISSTRVAIFYTSLTLISGIFIGYIVGWLFIGYPRWFSMSDIHIEHMDEYSP